MRKKIKKWIHRRNMRVEIEIRTNMDSVRTQLPKLLNKVSEETIKFRHTKIKIIIE